MWVGLCSLLLGPLSISIGCRVPPPSPREVLDVGFRDPIQTFQTFRTAFRGNLTDLEYRCLSAGFREREQLSEFGYRAFRDELLATVPLLRWALYKAVIEEAGRASPRRARIVARVGSHTLVVQLVREDFWEIWAGSQRRDGDDAAVDDAFGQGYLALATDPPRVYGQAPLNRPGLGERLTELRVGQEWKIDHFELLKGSAPPAE
ncbi:MAG: hypothetical protein ACI8QZ_001780 [Chlamydiales bacterium]|jgi:hypothetical protein